MLSHSVVFDFATPWTVACWAPLSVGFSRQEYWSGLPFASPGDLPNPEIEPRSPTLQVASLPAESQGKPHDAEMSAVDRNQHRLCGSTEEADRTD